MEPPRSCARKVATLRPGARRRMTAKQCFAIAVARSVRILDALATLAFGAMSIAVFALWTALIAQAVDHDRRAA